MNEVQSALLAWYERSGRAHLPWRVARDPYFTIVSEVMLAQTQVDRVVGKFSAFIAAYPTIGALAGAKTSDVVRLWQGLGYNSRAVRLVELARIIVRDFDGSIPRDEGVLRSLPGVGPYTVAAVRAFGFDEDVAAIDTNVRRIVTRLFFGIEYPPKATPAEIETTARSVVPPGAGHDWNSAMMDLGSGVCTARAPDCPSCPMQAVCAAAPVDASELSELRKRHAKSKPPQSAIPFRQTTRFARGRIVDRLRRLRPGRGISLLDLHRDLRAALPERSVENLAAIVNALETDGLLSRRGETVSLKD